MTRPPAEMLDTVYRRIAALTDKNFHIGCVYLGLPMKVMRRVRRIARRHRS